MKPEQAPPLSDGGDLLGGVALFRFTLSFRDVEELLAQWGIEVSRETIRCWALKFGQLITANLKRQRGPPTGRWHLDEMVVKIRGQRMFLVAGCQRRGRSARRARAEAPPGRGPSSVGGGAEAA